jgi:peptidoglycan hydrolase-like protein with peptidoglycan-binding domain
LSSTEVKQAQKALEAKGYDTGGIDGIIGPKTRQAIRDYQAAENIEVTGTLNVETASRLGVREESVGANFEGAGQEVGSGVKEAGEQMKEGKPVAAGKEFGKGVGRGAKEVGEGVKEAVDPESKPTKKQ